MKKIKYCPVCTSFLVRKIKDGDYRLICDKCGWTHYANPLPAVAAYIRNNDKILLVKRGVSPGKGKWALPTGFIEQRELPEQAVLRELKEETNLTGTINRLIGVYTEHTKLYGNIILIGYHVDYVGGKPKPGSDTTQAKFFPLKKLPVIAFKSHRALIVEGSGDLTTSLVEVLKSKITEATITHTQLYYKGSMGIDRKIMQAVNLAPGEKVHVLNYDNGERLETYTIEEESGSGKFVLYGPAAHKGKIGDRLCILSYAMVKSDQAHTFQAKVIVLDKRNRIKRRHT